MEGKSQTQASAGDWLEDRRKTHGFLALRDEQGDRRGSIPWELVQPSVPVPEEPLHVSQRELTRNFPAELSVIEKIKRGYSLNVL